MDLGIEGKVALVMGASKGIGRGAAQVLAEAGCRIAAVARDPETLEQTADELRVTGAEVEAFAADFTDPKAIAKTIQTISDIMGAPLIGLFNPPTPKPTSFVASEDTMYHEGFNDLVFSFSRFVRELIPGMQSARWGRIITVGSGTVFTPMREDEGGFAYAVANTGRLAAASLSKQVATELAPWQISVNTIGVGSISTATANNFFAARAAEQGLGFEEFNRARTSKIPMEREGSVREIGSLIAFLASEVGGFVTGQVIRCDGGWANTAI